MKRLAVPSLAAAFVGAFLSLSLPAAHAGHGGPEIKMTDKTVGTGERAVRFAKVKVHYTGWLTDGTKFDSSVDRGQPFEFVLAAGQVIEGWDEGVRDMRVGGKRELVIPPEMGYGKRGAPPTIPGGATLKFEVELLGVTPPNFANVGNDELKALIARGVPVVDIRRPDEWKKTGILEGSKPLMAFDDRDNFNPKFMEGFEKIVKGPDAEVILICRTGNRTAYLANALANQAGYTKVYSVTDGIVKWMADKNPVSAYK